MCGLTGAIVGTNAKRRVKDIDALTDVFTALLLLSEHRGPHATGVAWVKQDGSLQVAKAPLPARQFVQSDAYLDWLLEVDREITYLMGHTRWPSQGSVLNPANNHPLCLPVTSGGQSDQGTNGCLAVTHNGTILQSRSHFARLGLTRTAQVDSELLARIAQRHAGTTGIDLDAVLSDFSQLDGSISLALVATTRPEEILLLKGNMPLEIRLHRRKRVVLYASEARILEMALGGEAGWEVIPIVSGEALVFDTAAIHLPERRRFTFQGLARTVSWQRYTGQ